MFRLFLVLLIQNYIVTAYEWRNDSGYLSDMMNSECSVDLAFVLDASGSVGTNNWKTMVDFIKAFVNLLPLSADTNQIGVISFGNDATLHIPLNGYSSHSEFNRSVDNIVYKDENTNTAAGLRLLRTEMFTENGGDRSLKPNIAIVLTDGKPTYEVSETTPEANRVKSAGTFVFAIGIGAEGINVAELAVIASEPESKFVFRILKFEDLTTLLLMILEEVCKIKIETETTQPTVCRDKDIVFVLDSSGSVEKENWNDVKDFVVTMLAQIPIGPTNNQIGIIVFSTESWIYSHLGQHETFSDVVDVVINMPWIDQRTNTSGAIRLAREILFNTENGDRADYPNLIILISDGKSNTDEELTIPEAKATRDNDVRVFSVGVGLKANMAELEGIASRPTKYHTFLVEEFNQLATEGETGIFDAVCAHNYPDPQPDVAISACTSDMLFILDASSAMGMANFMTLQDALGTALKKFSSSSNRMAFIPFGSDPQLIPFNYFPSDYINNPIDKLRYLDGVGFNVQSLGPQIDEAVKDRRTGVTMPIILITATAPTSGDGTEALFRNIKENTHSPVFAVVLGADSSSIGEMMTSQPAENFLFEVGSSLEKTIDHVLTLACLSSAEVVYFCDFENTNKEKELCDITQSTTDKMDWLHKEGGTPSRHTGPDKAFSMPYYMYIEATGKKNGDDAMLFLPLSQTNTRTYCIYFAYHMHGFHIGSLQVIRIHNNKERIIWMKSGPQSEEWLYSEVGVTLKPGDKIGFRAVRAEEFSGDIALDSVVVKSGPCPMEYTMDSL